MLIVNVIYVLLHFLVCDCDIYVDDTICKSWTQRLPEPNLGKDDGSTPTAHTGPLFDHTFHNETGDKISVFSHKDLGVTQSLHVNVYKVLLH